MVLFIYDIATTIVVYKLVVKLVHITTVNLFCICYSKFVSFTDVGKPNEQIIDLFYVKIKKEKNKKKKRKRIHSIHKKIWDIMKKIINRKKIYNI